MKKIKSLICSMLAFMMIVSSSVTAFAAEKEADIINEVERQEEAIPNNKKGMVEIYNGQGELVATMTEEEFEEIENSSRNWLTRVVAWIWAHKGEIIATIDVVAELNGVSLIDWAAEHVYIPFTESASKFKIYSSSGHCFNPYPPNSYQGAMWKKNNFYTVLYY